MVLREQCHCGGTKTNQTEDISFQIRKGVARRQGFRAARPRRPQSVELPSVLSPHVAQGLKSAFTAHTKVIFPA